MSRPSLTLVLLLLVTPPSAHAVTPSAVADPSHARDEADRDPGLDRAADSSLSLSARDRRPSARLSALERRPLSPRCGGSEGYEGRRPPGRGLDRKVSDRKDSDRKSDASKAEQDAAARGARQAHGGGGSGGSGGGGARGGGGSGGGGGGGGGVTMPGGVGMLASAETDWPAAAEGPALGWATPESRSDFYDASARNREGSPDRRGFAEPGIFAARRPPLAFVERARFLLTPSLPNRSRPSRIPLAPRAALPGRFPPEGDAFGGGRAGAPIASGGGALAAPPGADASFPAAGGGAGAGGLVAGGSPGSPPPPALTLGPPERWRERRPGQRSLPYLFASGSPSTTATGTGTGGAAPTASPPIVLGRRMTKTAERRRPFLPSSLVLPDLPDGNEDSFEEDFFAARVKPAGARPTPVVRPPPPVPIAAKPAPSPLRALGPAGTLGLLSVVAASFARRRRNGARI